MATSTLFGEQTPAGVFNDATAYVLGTRFTPTTDGEATHGRWHFPPIPPDGTVTVGIYRDSDESLLATADFVSPVGDAWNTVAFASPVPLTSGVGYTVVILTANRYVASFAYAWPTGSGDVVSAISAAGRFSASGTLVYPTSDTGAAYFADIIFETADADAVTPDGIAVPLAVGEPTVSQALTVTPDGIAVPVTLGSPTLAQALTVTPGGIAVSVAVGTPTLTFSDAVPPAPGSWDTLSGIVREARSDHERNQERIANPIDCPDHGWPLNGRHCLFGGHVV